MTNFVQDAKQTVAKASLFREAPEVPEQPNPLLISILRTKRSHGSPGDINFRIWLKSYIEKTLKTPCEIRAEGCIVAVTDPKSDTLFSCHMDTVHSSKESDGSSQDLAYDQTFGHIVLAQGSTSGCLGADDGAGIYVMLRMIEAKVPGSYIFHTGEEMGGIGSRAMLTKHRDWLDNFSRAIAFDRAVQVQEKPEVICTQGGQICASLDFGNALVKALNEHSKLFSDDWCVSHKGSFTDTKVYASVIPECVNLGVFYARQHSPHEFLDVAHLESLITAACLIKWDGLKAIRKPVAPQPYSGSFADYSRSRDKSFYEPDAQTKKGFYESGAQTKKSKPKMVTPPPVSVENPTTYIAEMEDYTLEDYLIFCTDNPEAAAKTMAVMYAKYSALTTEVDLLTAMLSS